jgi:hypothetical protein
MKNAKNVWDNKRLLSLCYAASGEVASGSKCPASGEEGQRTARGT